MPWHVGGVTPALPSLSSGSPEDGYGTAGSFAEFRSALNHFLTNRGGRGDDC